MKTIIAALSLVFFSTMAFAETMSFADADIDENGSLSIAEVQLALPDVSDADVAAVDADENGELNESEYADLIAE